jgi:REP element-mobilizing transposase RayT
MSNYSQIHIQVVFAVNKRKNIISPEWEEDLYKYITGIVKSKEQKLIAINGMPDHIHLFIGMKPSCCLSELVREIKKSSTNYITENHLSRYAFNWQEGFGAFSYSHSHIDRVVKYILNQTRHHRKEVLYSTMYYILYILLLQHALYQSL